MRVGVMITIDSFGAFFTVENKAALLSLADVDFSLAIQYADLSDLEKTRRLQGYDVLVGGWGAGALPYDYTPSAEQLYCCCTGTVAAQMSPEHLERGLRLCNWGDAISQYISESALMQMLASVRMVGLHYDCMHVRKQWRDGFPPSQSLFDRHIGLLGCGVIAQKLIPLLRPFNPAIYAYDPYVSDEKFAELGVQRAETVRDIFTHCDVISNHLPKIEATNDLINAEMLALLPDHGVLVNTARGNSLDEEALLAEHQRDRLFSSLDVYKTEPVAEDHPLRQQPRCIMMCHQGGPTLDSYHKMGARALENIQHFKNGEALIQEISADGLRRMT